MEKRFIYTKNDAKDINKIKDLGFQRIRYFTNYYLASGVQKIDISNLNEKNKKLIIEFLNTRVSNKNRVKLLYKYKNEYFEIRMLHGCGYSWGTDFLNEFIDYILNNYKINKKSKTYKNILYLDCQSIF